MLFQFTDHTLNKHTADHLSHADISRLVHIPSWCISPGEHWAVVGGKEEQRSALLELLTRHAHSSMSLAEISPREQQRLIDIDVIKSKTGIADEIVHGTQVFRLLDSSEDLRSLDTQTQARIKQLNFNHCLLHYFRQLSSGETRRLLLLKALQKPVDLLLLEDPLEGLDAETRPVATQLMNEFLHESSQQRSSVFICSRPEQLFEFTTHLAYFNGDELCTLALNNKENGNLKQALASLATTLNPQVVIPIPELPVDHPYHEHKKLANDIPLVAMKGVSVSYADVDKPIFSGLNWQVQRGQHWRVTGPNGSGKSTLLKLITGDHPQVYCNNIQICGYQRGSGESVWDIKRHIGFMSGEMLWNYRGSGQLAGKALDVVISGLYDSVGLYVQPGNADKQCARAWLELFDMGELSNRRFRALSLAEQRLVMIARAMVKRPSLLILDEPLQGLDGTERHRVLQIIEKLIDANACTLLYVSHHEDEQLPQIEHTLRLPVHR